MASSRSSTFVCERAGRTGRGRRRGGQSSRDEYVHLPSMPKNPDAHLIDNFIAAVTRGQSAATSTARRRRRGVALDGEACAGGWMGRAARAD